MRLARLPSAGRADLVKLGLCLLLFCHLDDLFCGQVFAVLILGVTLHFFD